MLHFIDSIKTVFLLFTLYDKIYLILYVVVSNCDIDCNNTERQPDGINMNMGN